MTTDESESNNEESYNVFIYNEDTKNEIPSDVTHVKVDPSVQKIPAYAFQDCLWLVEVEFSEGLEVIGRNAFYECRNLKHTNKLPSTLREIGDFAFNCCSNLDSIEFPEGLQVVGEAAFASCSRVERIKIASAHVVIKRGAFGCCISLTSVELPEGLQVIREYCFLECKSLTTVKVESSVIQIEADAFRGCTSLASLDLPEGLQSIGDRSFQGCESLESLHIPSTVCKIGTGVFSECTGLKHMHIPSNVARIGARAFQGCTQLAWVHLLGNLHTIEEFTFRDCAFLTHLKIPSSVTRIERSAFSDCTRLISLELPEGLDMIDLDLVHYEDYYARPNICGWPSLVNLVLPTEQHVQQLGDDVHEVMEGLKLGTVVNNFDDLVIKLQHRFDSLPVHRLCYYQSYYPLMETIQNLRKSIDTDPSAVRKVDYFGMTPFHILALSQTPNLSLFQALLKVYKVDIICTRDKFGSTPMDYLCLNHTPDASGVFKSLIVQRIQWLGLGQWKVDMLVALNEILAVDWSSRRREIGILYFYLATYERLEAISLLELALWKVNIDERKAVQSNEHLDYEGSLKKLILVESDLGQEEGADRQSCRIKSGAEVVILNVLPFLDKVCLDDYYSED
jgi:hypothetical protein